MEDKTRDAIKFITSLRTSTIGTVGYQLSAKQVNVHNTKLNEIAFMIDRLEKVGNMWNWFKDNNGDLIIMYPSHRKTVRELMDEAEVKFLGSKPDRRTKINRMVRNIRALLSGTDDVEQDWKIAGIIELFEELRDEEENV